MYVAISSVVHLGHALSYIQDDMMLKAICAMLLISENRLMLTETLFSKTTHICLL